MVSNSLQKEAVLLSLHRHRPRTLKVCFNNYFIIYIYCADCKEFLSKYIEKSEYEECPIGATDSTALS